MRNNQKKAFRFWHLSEIIWTKAVFNLRSEMHNNFLSYLWWVLEPLLHMMVYFIVFKFLLNRGGANFTVFLLVGLIPWLWFSKAVASSNSSLIMGKNLLLQSGVPPIFFPLVKLLQCTLKQIPVFVLLLIFVWIRGLSPGLHWLALVPIMVVQLFITMACVLAVAGIIPFVRDFSLLVPTGLAFLFFVSGIFFDYQNISPEWQGLFLKNPIAYLIACYREVLMAQSVPHLPTLFCVGLVAGASCLVIALIYKQLRYVFAKVVME